MKRIILILTFSIFSIGLISYLSLWWFFENSIDRVLSKGQQEWIMKEFENTPRLPDKFYFTMRKHIPNFFDIDTWNYHLGKLNHNNRNVCQCAQVYLPYIPNKEEGFNPRWIPLNQGDKIIKMFIENKFTQEDCYTFNMRNYGFGHNTRSIEEAAELFFNKNLEQLDEKEIVGLYVIQQAITAYSPILNPYAYERKVEQIMKN